MTGGKHYLHSMRLIASILVVITLAANLQGKDQKSIEQLRSEAEKAGSLHQSLLYAELAERLVDQADQQFTQGESVKGQATVQEILSAATRARDDGMRSHHKLKETEIHLRQTQRRLESMRRTLSAEDRPEVEAVEKKLADYRQDLLNAMFSPHHEKPAEKDKDKENKTEEKKP
jgi:hypothetical protein